MTIAQQIGKIHRATEVAFHARDFVNLARIVALSRGDYARARLAVQEHADEIGPRVKAIVENPNRIAALAPRIKAAVGAGSTSDSSFALPLAEYNVMASAFLETLRSFGAFDRLLPSMKRVPFRVRIGASTSGATATTVGQGQTKPISRLTLSGGALDEMKIVAILVATQELIRFGSTVAGDLFATELSNAVAVQTDSEFVSQLTSGAAGFTSNGTTAEHVRVDLRGLLGNVTTGARSSLFILTTSAIAKALCVLHDNSGGAAFPGMRFSGGEIGGIPVVVSDGVSAGSMILVDATQVAAASEDITLEGTDAATIQLDSAPDSPPGAGTAPLTPLWQNNLFGLRATRYIGVEKLTATGVAVVTGISYSGDSPGP